MMKNGILLIFDNPSTYPCGTIQIMEFKMADISDVSESDGLNPSVNLIFKCILFFTLTSLIGECNSKQNNPVSNLIKCRPIFPPIYFCFRETKDDTYGSIIGFVLGDRPPVARKQLYVIN